MSTIYNLLSLWQLMALLNPAKVLYPWVLWLSGKDIGPLDSNTPILSGPCIKAQIVLWQLECHHESCYVAQIATIFVTFAPFDIVQLVPALHILCVAYILPINVRLTKACISMAVGENNFLEKTVRT